MRVIGQNKQFKRKLTTVSTPSSMRSKKKIVQNRNKNSNFQHSREVFGVNDQEINKFPQISSTSWCLYDNKNNKYIGFRQNYQREVASLTKIMTVIVSLSLIEKYSLDKQIVVKVSKTASQLNGTSAQLKYGSWIRLYDLLYGAMLPSGNDAAYLLTEVLGLLLFYQKMKPEDKQYQDIQSINICLYENTQPFVGKFLKQMNYKARQLKMWRTSYANPHGLSNVLNFSSAADMLVLSKYACENDQFRKIMNTEEYECEIYSQNLQVVIQTKRWVSTNKLLSKGWQGLKTGQTIPAGSCLASIKNQVYIVILNCNKIDARFDETQILYNWYTNI